MTDRQLPQQQFDRRVVEGPLGHSVWLLAWPTMVQNIIGGLQGVVDQVLVGNYVGHIGNAAIGVSMQIFILVIVFVASIFTGMAVLVARFAGAGDADKVNRSVYQAFIVAIGLSLGVLAPLGYWTAPALLNAINATPDVQVEALPYIRIMFVFSFGMLSFFMFSGAVRAAGDAKTPMRLGILMTGLNVIFSVVLISGFGPIPAFGTRGAAMGSVLASGITSLIFIWLLFSNRLVIRFSRTMAYRPDWKIIRQLFRFGLPAGFQGIVMNLGGLLMLRFIGALPFSAQAQGVYSVGYTQLFSLITWTSHGLLGAATVMAGQNLGAGHPDRVVRSTHISASLGLGLAGLVGTAFIFIPEPLLALFGMTEGTVVALGRELLWYLAISGLFVTVAMSYTGALQGTGDTRGPFYISIVSQLIVPVGLCTVLQAVRGLESTDIWLAIVLGHMTRCLLSILRFRQGHWRRIAVDIGSA
jgi:putative MATE family efflux protein